MNGQRKERPKNGNEQDWCSRYWRRLLCVFSNHTGLGRAVKRAMNKRFRKRARQTLRLWESDE